MPSSAPSRFHLAIHVHDLDAARAFYVDVLGCRPGRSAPTWLDLDFFGHQLSLHVGRAVPTTPTGQVDGTAVPMPHFGAILPTATWRAVVARLEAADTAWILAPHTRFAGLPGEQHTLFVGDPSGNGIELKGADDPASLLDA